jgi:hypothetical protein
MALFLMDYYTARIMILGWWSSDTFLVYIRPQVLVWTNNIIQNDSFFDATDVPQADTDDPRTLAPAAASLSMVTDPFSFGYTSSTESEALRAPRRFSIVGVHHSGI